MHKPVNVIRDTVRPVCIKRRLDISEATPGSNAETNSGNSDAHTGDGRVDNHSKSGLSAETGSGIIINRIAGDEVSIPNPDAGTGSGSGLSRERVILERRLKLGFSVSPDFMAKYNKIKSLLSGKYPEGINFETLFDTLMTEYLEKHNPERRRARRENRSRTTVKQDFVKRGKTSKQNTEKHQAQGSKRMKESNQPGKSDRRSKDMTPRHIPPAVRDHVYDRDKGKCTFVGANGKRCDSKWDLELDHITPVAQGGDNSPDNLRLLCRKHNIHQAERVYGREFMKKHIRAKQDE